MIFNRQHVDAYLSNGGYESLQKLMNKFNHEQFNSDLLYESLSDAVVDMLEAADRGLEGTSVDRAVGAYVYTAMKHRLFKGYKSERNTPTVSTLTSNLEDEVEAQNSILDSLSYDQGIEESFDSKAMLSALGSILTETEIYILYHKTVTGSSFRSLSVELGIERRKVSAMYELALEKVEKNFTTVCPRDNQNAYINEETPVVILKRVLGIQQ